SLANQASRSRTCRSAKSRSRSRTASSRPNQPACLALRRSTKRIASWRLVRPAARWWSFSADRPSVGSGPRIRGEARELSPQARRDQIDKGADLGNTKPALRGDDMDRQWCGLVRSQHNLQRAVPYMLGDLIGEHPRQAAPFGGRGDRRAYAVDDKARR